MRRRDSGFELHPMLWRFDQLHDSRWRETALQDAVRAAILTLAMPHIEALCPPIESWLDELLVRRCGADLRVLALIGQEDAWTLTLSLTKPIEIPAAMAARHPPEVFGGVVSKSVTARAA